MSAGSLPMCTLAGFRALPSIVYLSLALSLTACFGGNSEIRTIVPEDSDDRSVSSVPEPDSTPVDEPVPASGPVTVDDSATIDEPATASDPATIDEPVVASVPTAFDEPVVARGPQSITDLVLITGQSNALGSLTAFDPVLDSPVDRFYAYTDSGWQPASLRQVWDLGWHPRTESDTDPHNNFGFHFGKNVVAKSNQRVVGIVLVTAPGEGISHWDSQGFFYNKVRNKALAALNELPQKEGFDAVLWHQGETDWAAVGSLDVDLAGVGVANDYYSQKLRQLIDNFRNDSWFAPDRPFICGETARSPVNSRLNALNQDDDPWTSCVSGSDLPTYDAEQVHFNAAGLRQLGANYADRYLDLVR